MPIMGQTRFSVLWEPMGSGLVMKLQAHLHASKWDIMVELSIILYSMVVCNVIKI